MTKGTKYNSGMNLKEIAKAVRKELKKAAPGCKFSVRTQYYSGGQSLHVELKAGPFDAFTNPEVKDMQLHNNYSDYETYKDRVEEWKENRAPYEPEIKEMTKACFKVVKKMTEITEAYNYDRSDSQTDYFDVNFYSHYSIDSYNKTEKK